jgi:ABC-type nickel/cobalt efflux system permease component RcnA
MRVARVALFILCALAAAWLAVATVSIILADDVELSAAEWLLFFGAPLILLLFGVWGYQRVAPEESEDYPLPPRDDAV